MKISICDICNYEKRKNVESKYRTGYKGSEKIDLCVNHKNWGKGKTKEQFYKDYAILGLKYYENN